ncbi:uroporphyrinogen-III synthase [Rhodohalobacter halophilus]|uniref:uroporphyrinogen-III synthase n=1 Tax=Rhodohalobacter halophilus TaxID=1812810 RepID=UPI00083FD5AD|nr:uroporphyrinogen-III synthase [Rhodohalobacter halophilus]
MPTAGSHKILVTRDLSDDQITLAEEVGLKVVIEPAIDFEFRTDWSSVVATIDESANPIFAFTSQNGVTGLKKLLSRGYQLPKESVIYAVGGKTAEALSELGFTAIIPELQYGEHLGRKIAEDVQAADIKDVTVIHFCGNRRREEMRQVLENSGVKVKDIVVYNTILNNMDINLDGVEGILFYSPSAVEAFRKSGGFRGKNLPELFAIGQTTGQELSIESGRNVHISPEPDTEQLLKFTARILSESSHSEKA